MNEHYKRWDEEIRAPFVRKSPERKPVFATGSGAPVEPLYDEIPDEHRERIGYPGVYPYTRGILPTMYRGKHWTMRQYAGFSTAAETNARYRYLLSQGQTGLSVAFDLPTQLGYDSDAPQAKGEVGKVGVAIDSLADMETLFAGIPMDNVSTSMTINAPAAILLSFYIAAAEKQGISRDKLQGTIQNDVLKEYIARGTYIFPPRPSLRLITDIFAYCASDVPQWNTISISGYHIREAGSTAAQEIAFTLADGITYVEEALKVGLDVDAFAPRLSFFFNAHNDLFEEVAKFRAARRLWATLMKDRFGAKSAKSLMLRFHTQTAGSMLTAQQPDNNIVRVAIQALAAVLGGTQSLHTNGKDEALGLPTAQSALIALRTQQIIANESGVDATVDPLGGSYYVEALTDSLEAEAREYIAKIDELGGMVEAIAEGYVQRQIQEASYRYQREVEAKQRVVVGVNEYVVANEAPTEIQRLDPALEKAQVERLAVVRANRSAGDVERCLASIRSAAQGAGNLMPHFVAAAHAYCSIGEICGVLREVFGEHKEYVVI